MKLFLFGAGSTAGTLSDVPVASCFGHGLQAVDPRWPHRYPAIASVAKHLGRRDAGFGLEPIWTVFDYYAKLHAALPWQKPWAKETPNIKSALLAVYGTRVDQMADHLPLGTSATLCELFRDEVKVGDLLASFNYDTLVERLACRHGHKLVAVRPGSRLSSSAVNLAKPHGSTSWIMDLNSTTVRVAASRGRPLLCSLTPADVARKTEPILLGAVPVKSELIEQVQGTDWKAIYDSVAAQWSAILQALRRARTLVVVGYSFPPEDLYGRFMLAEGMRRRRPRSLRVEFFELPRYKKRRAKVIQDALGDRVVGPFYRGRVSKR